MADLYFLRKRTLKENLSYLYIKEHILTIYISDYILFATMQFLKIDKVRDFVTVYCITTM